MDSREDEQERGITMKSSAISLFYQKGKRVCVCVWGGGGCDIICIKLLFFFQFWFTVLFGCCCFFYMIFIVRCNFSPAKVLGPDSNFAHVTM